MNGKRSACTVAMAATAILLVACSGSHAPVAAGSPADQTGAGGQNGSTSVTTTIIPGLNVQGPALPLNDVANITFGLAASQLATEMTPTVLFAPALAPVPPAQCDSGYSAPLTPLAPPGGVQGRVTAADINSPQADQGWACNMKLVSNYGDLPGGFRTWRYTDTQGHTCAYYDTSFAGGPTAIVSLGGGPSLGVAVLDMDDPAHPQLVKTLTDSLAMLAPHESLNLNAKRGLLAADVGNAATLPGTMAIYDISGDCRNPVLKGQFPSITGHESGFSPDGNTFWIAGGFGYIQAIDVTDPTQPKELWRGPYYSHGLNFSADGDTLYHTDTVNGNLGLMDVSEIQNRDANPRVRDIARVSWPTATIPQNTVPFTRDGHQYLLEFEEFAFRFNPATVNDSPGAARILNIDDPAHPFIVSNIRLAVNMQAEHKAADLDPTPLPPNQVLGYAFHYCALPTQDNPQIAACSTITSGLRVFDISDVAHPREVAYFLAPPKAGRLLKALQPLTAGGSVLSQNVANLTNTLTGVLPNVTAAVPDPSILTTEILDVGPGELAFSQPAFDPARCQIWYTDSISGFYVLQVPQSIWAGCTAQP
ncbi:MAG: hypothetical protein EPN72_10740 [Nevskiaceae bacterium]|nr:MAG: hypothetical protein EPN63_05750 [Nevskiaceae bacterium]TBR72223.1 MAG: hypothetical protein EPN72_10740 [Nevskiaceae bacterium]